MKIWFIGLSFFLGISSQAMEGNYDSVKEPDDIVSALFTMPVSDLVSLSEEITNTYQSLQQVGIYPPKREESGRLSPQTGLTQTKLDDHLNYCLAIEQLFVEKNPLVFDSGQPMEGTEIAKKEITFIDYIRLTKPILFLSFPGDGKFSSNHEEKRKVIIEVEQLVEKIFSKTSFDSTKIIDAGMTNYWRIEASIQAIRHLLTAKPAVQPAELIKMRYFLGKIVKAFKQRPVDRQEDESQKMSSCYFGFLNFNGNPDEDRELIEGISSMMQRVTTVYGFDEDKPIRTSVKALLKEWPYLVIESDITKNTYYPQLLPFLRLYLLLTKNNRQEGSSLSNKNKGYNITVLRRQLYQVLDKTTQGSGKLNTNYFRNIVLTSPITIPLEEVIIEGTHEKVCSYKQLGNIFSPYNPIYYQVLVYKSICRVLTPDIAKCIETYQDPEDDQISGSQSSSRRNPWFW